MWPAAQAEANTVVMHLLIEVRLGESLSYSLAVRLFLSSGKIP